MSPKSPSSLDYDALLHELTLQKWHQALVDVDDRRAEAYARQLAASPERLWRFLGWNKLAVTHFAAGRQAQALDATEQAIRTFGRSRDISLVALILEAHAHLELGSASRSAEALEGRAARSPEARYFGALANARSGRADVARALVAPISGSRRPLLEAFVLHVKSETDRDPEALDAAAEAVASLPLDGPEPVFSIRFAFAERLIGEGLYEKGAEQLEALSGASGARAHWPIPFTRSLYLQGVSHRALDGPGAAKESFERFLALWSGGDMDRDRVSDARQFVSA